jgi:hypothetical protein
VVYVKFLIEYSNLRPIPAAHAMCTAFSVVTVSALLPWLRLT